MGSIEQQRMYGVSLGDLEKLLREAKRIVVLTHSNADIDAVASICIAGYLARELGVPDIKCLVPESISAEARKVAERCSSYGVVIEAVKKSVSLPEQIDLCVILDTASLEQLKNLKDVVSLCRYIIVIDHHIQREPIATDKEVRYLVDPEASSTSELLTELLSDRLESIPSELLEVLLAGIIFDTKRFSRGSARTFRNVAKLLELGAKYDNAISLTLISRPPHYRIARIKCLLRHRGFKVSLDSGEYVLLALSEIGAYESDCANTLLSIGYDIAFVVTEDDLLKASRVVYRARDEALDKLGIEIHRDIISKLIQLFGGGGGGHRVAGAAILRIRDTDRVARELIKVLSQLFKDRIAELAESKVAS